LNSSEISNFYLAFHPKEEGCNERSELIGYPIIYTTI